MNKKQLFYIGIASFILQIINMVVFFAMNDYMMSSNLGFMDYFMYYLSFVLILVSFLVALTIYILRSNLTKIKQIIMSIIFYLMLLNVAIFVATYIFVLRQ
jgi:hypothetical protein